MNLSSYYWWFKSAVPPRICDDIVNYGLKHEEDVAITGGLGRDRDLQKQPLNKRELKDLKNSPDYTCIYGVDVAKDSCELVIEYDDNRRKNRTWHIPLENNKFIIFPSTQRYFISQNKSKQMNIFLTMTYTYI